jgi:hypothetical protein
VAKKFTKTQNPYDVRQGQTWYRNDPERKNRKFTILDLFLNNNIPYAKVEYPKTKKAKGSIRRIQLGCFGRYIKVSD